MFSWYQLALPVSVAAGCIFQKSHLKKKKKEKANKSSDVRVKIPVIFSGLSEKNSSTFPSSGNWRSGILHKRQSERSDIWTGGAPGPALMCSSHL